MASRAVDPPLPGTRPAPAPPPRSSTTVLGAVQKPVAAVASSSSSAAANARDSAWSPAHIYHEIVGYSRPTEKGRELNARLRG